MLDSEIASNRVEADVWDLEYIFDIRKKQALNT